MTKFRAYFTDESPKRTVTALEDAYRIHGDGVATMIPEKLVEREEFQRVLSEIDSLEIIENDTSDHEKN